MPITSPIELRSGGGGAQTVANNNVSLNAPSVEQQASHGAPRCSGRERT
jgi:hypothetical protein